MILGIASFSDCGTRSALTDSASSSASFSVTSGDEPTRSYEAARAEVDCSTYEDGELLRVGLAPSGAGLYFDLKPFGPGTFHAQDRAAADELESPLYCDAPCVAFSVAQRQPLARSERSLKVCYAVVAEESAGYFIRFECLGMPNVQGSLTSIEGEVFCGRGDLDDSDS